MELEETSSQKRVGDLLTGHHPLTRLDRSERRSTQLPTHGADLLKFGTLNIQTPAGRRSSPLHHCRSISDQLSTCSSIEQLRGEVPVRIWHAPSKSFTRARRVQRIWRVDDPNWPLEEAPIEELPKLSWCPRASMRSHMDAIRDLHFHTHHPVLASASEDCTIKLWNVSKIKADSNEPFFTLRGHMGPVLALAGGQFLYSGDVYGAIRVWSVPAPGEVHTYSANKGRNFCTYSCKAHSDTVWCLDQHPSTQNVLSLSADDTVKLWNALDEGATLQLANVYPCNSGMPRACAWVDTQLDSFAVAYSQHLCVTNAESKASTFLTSEATAPANCIAVKDSVVYAGHEDQRIRQFDLRIPREVHSFVAHADAVSTLALGPEYLVSGGQEGSIRTWDLRKHECVHEVPAHRRKYDEAVNVLKLAKGLMASGGADSIIKVFKEQYI